ncbi:hypothetical protein ACYULU_15340 [Breznakiellaceae bacterium SP9]
MRDTDSTGASGAIPVSDQKRRNAHATRFYEEVRKRTTDIQVIAKNTGWDVSSIEKIKNHIFFTEHDLGYAVPVRFDPDYDMAVSWQRLTEGTGIREEDYILLQHEYLELQFMEQEGLSYSEAHSKASEQYNYAAVIKRKEQL